MIKKAIIPAAGYGTRSLPISKVIPKEMFPIGIKPAIQYVVEEAIESGIEQILMVVSRSKNLIVDYFDHSLELEAFLERKNKMHLMDAPNIPDIQIHYTRQPIAKGLGDAIRLGKSFVNDEPFAVLLPDDIILHKHSPSLKQLIDVFTKYKESVIGLQTVDEKYLNQYGVIKGKKHSNDTYRLTDIVEKPKINPPSQLAVIGRYVFTPMIFEQLDKIKRGIGGEYQLTDGMKALLQSENIYGKLIEGQRYDIGSMDDYMKLLNFVYSNMKNG
ncbi:UTP--glucose-1-phosphate uridylyltransferase [Cytobacillus sp. IB215665]|uniref:UTP--glucose-1-phosphate uridylyltransferase n=1 Tax=Cytobacillus sp. IB215665 TaxID=3097357 RepID=UPI002A0BDD51|nr:UTP--glucose-1-phosphate uridylyltransferase [Cytobacillus sp. IB215665]MDX8364404.1 UTP--glucose-1-phosphate uridylyltransferase [Cytobacillus sp. IB215665]